MVEKKTIIKELGENELLLPGLVNTALIANDKIKYYFTLLQTAKEKAEHPESELSDLRVERITAGEKDAELDTIVSSTVKLDNGKFIIPQSCRILNSIYYCIEEMIRPFTISGRNEGTKFSSRFRELSRYLPEPDSRVISEEDIFKITSGNRDHGDSIHILVMDLHKALNALQGEIAAEVVDGASTYMLTGDDKSLVKAFMRGLNRTAPLKFGHPGLGTTATRSEQKLLIQNDIGETDAHVMVIDVREMDVSITYTDVHMPRLLFFQSLFDKHRVKWQDTLSKSGKDKFEDRIYHLSIGKYTASDMEDLEAFLEHLGSRIVFLIDWNKARKQLRNFMRNRDCIQVLKRAAENEKGHRGFIVLGGKQLIFEALEIASKIPMRYGEPLHQVIGREKTMEFFEWVLEKSTTGLLEKQTHLFIQDEIKAELLRYFHSAHQDLMELCSEHASLMVEMATTVHDSLLYIQYGEDDKLIKRNAVRAKKWENDADELVTRVRSLSRRIEVAEFFTTLIIVADDVVDYLEEAIFMTTVAGNTIKSKNISTCLYSMARLSLKGCQEFLKALYASQYVSHSYTQEEMQNFLKSVNFIFDIEEECDDALRTTKTTILAESIDFREAYVALDIAANIEEATNSLMKASFTIKDNIFEELNLWGMK
ncbi:MAG: hypothetical protein PWQ75_25 [Methanolobus sp.]|jgi:hypothetical protein|uniref:hypothetical protein n=1 Tax=Methanolobus sp. TaxID=1874737 RepID=UPI00258E18D7|nr:hypothetical protein [Methanolobus sp.]MDK2830273.1 hypothetical protein [Methanolobus sp.]